MEMSTCVLFVSICREREREKSVGGGGWGEGGGREGESGFVREKLSGSRNGKIEKMGEITKMGLYYLYCIMDLVFS